ncbi:glycosyltransferase family 39 protein [Aerosakkonema funiforme]|uniref:glycosyltransferase family 39 protein n=1 Tax=Aerosakkonema funiforme TaxID=1246630 RepID=UPI002AC7FF0B|nr:glycosyltransferase family 39 protein [Aerosakkonema funiforme]
MIQSEKDNQFKKGLLVLAIIWLAGAVCDRIWFAIDHSIPAWDQADYLTGSLNYWRALQHPQWFSGEWWTSFWQLTSKVPPFTYIATGIVQNVFGTGADKATLVNLFFSAILLVSVYGLGVELFSVEVGLLAAAICQVLPGLYRFRLDFLLDYPLASVVTLAFYCLTVWRAKISVGNSHLSWFWAAAFGLAFGLALMVKQTAIFFLFIPIVLVINDELRNFWKNLRLKIKNQPSSIFNATERLAQLLGALLLSVLVFGPWYRTNWLLMLTAGKRATVDSAIAEGDPALNTIDAWIFYWKDLPYVVSWPLLLVPIVGLLLYLGKLAIRGVEQLRRKTSEEIEPLRKIAAESEQMSAWQAEFKKTGKMPPEFRKAAAEIEKQMSAWPPELRKTAAEIEQQPVLQIKLWHKVIVLSCCCLYYLGILLNLKLEFRDLRGTGGNSFTRSPIKWLAIFLVSAYLLCSLNINKDTRYVLPYLPVLSLFLAYWLTLWTGRWSQYIRRITIGLAILLMLANIYPIGGTWLTQILSPRFQHYPYIGAQFPHQQVIAEIVKTEPYLRSTLGVLPSTPELNQHNFNYYGALSDFQVYGRQVGTRKKHLQQDARSVSWFLTKTGDQGSVPSEAQSAIVQIVEQGGDFQLQKSWNLPDGSNLNLYHSRKPPVQVQPLSEEVAKQEIISQSAIPNPKSSLAKVGIVTVTGAIPILGSPQVEDMASKTPTSRKIQNLKLNRVTVPDRSPPGVPVPVVYDWSGSWNQLQSGLVLLTWRSSAVSPSQATKSALALKTGGTGKMPIPQAKSLSSEVGVSTGKMPIPQAKSLSCGVGVPPAQCISKKSQTKQQGWLHDHAIGMGNLHPGNLTDDRLTDSFRVIERTAMLPPADVVPGIYTLEATYLNRQTGETYPIAVPPVTLKIDPTAKFTPAPELDLLTQLRTLAAQLPQGSKALDRVFDQTGRINQYDPTQDYLIQASKTLNYRLAHSPQNLQLAYALALAKVLRRQPAGAIAALERVTKLDSQNPYAYAYLSFVHLYDWNPSKAEKALKPALALNPNLPEIQALSGAAALMQGNLIEAWHYFQPLITI